MKKLPIIEAIGIVGMIGSGAYYTYYNGWWGLLYSVVAAIFGFMVVFYFADLFPIIGPLLRRLEQKDRSKSTEK